jgi:hypothetical protein
MKGRISRMPMINATLRASIDRTWEDSGESLFLCGREAGLL